MSRVFISYSRKDSAIAEHLAGELEQSGHSVFIDKNDIDPGEQWRRTIVEAIESSDVFLLLLSTHSMESDQVRREVDIATESSIRILPVELESISIPTAFKYQLAGLERHNLSGDFDAGFKELLEFLSTRSGESVKVKPSKAEEKSGQGLLMVRIMTFIAIVFGAVITFVTLPNPVAADGTRSNPMSIYLMLCGTIYAQFNVMESLVRDNVLKEISRWMLDTKEKITPALWTNVFLHFFDNLFAIRQITNWIFIPSFLRSCFASLLFTFLLLGVMTFSGAELFVYKIEIFPDAWASNGTLGAVLEALLFMFLLSIVFNVIPDYISLIKARYILQKLRTTTNNNSAILLLVLDFVFTLFIAFAASAIADVLSPLVTYVISGFNTRELTKWSIPFDFKGLLQVYGMVLHLLDMGDSAKIVNVCAVFIYSNFLTSLWIWLYVLSGLVIHFGISYKALNLKRAVKTCEKLQTD